MPRRDQKSVRVSATRTESAGRSFGGHAVIEPWGDQNSVAHAGGCRLGIPQRSFVCSRLNAYNLNRRMPQDNWKSTPSSPTGKCPPPPFGPVISHIWRQQAPIRCPPKWLQYSNRKKLSTATTALHTRRRTS